MNDYYVYIYYRLDINEPFYVGMGHNDRWKRTDGKHRNKHFKNIMNKHLIACEIIKENLTEDEAHGIECWLINELVFEYGYSIDIQNNRSNEMGCHLVNATWGGEGVSGLNMRENKTEEELIEINNKISKTKKESGIAKGENNPMWGHVWGNNHPMKGKHHTEEAKKKISETRIKKGIGKGENHPNYGKHLSEETKDILREKALERIADGVYNFLKVKVICLTDMKIYNSLVEASENEDYINVTQNGISSVCNNYRNCKIHGKSKDGKPLIWMYLEDYEEMTEEEVKQYLSTVKITKGGINNSNARKFILKFNDIDLTSVLTKKQLCKFLKTDEKTLNKILDNNGIIDKSMFSKNISKVIQYFDKCEIVELDK